MNGEQQTAMCEECGQATPVTALTEVTCTGDCERKLSVCKLDLEDPYTCINCDTGGDDDDDKDEGGTD